VVAGGGLSFKVRDGWCEIRVGKGLGFCFFIGLLQNEICFFSWACCTLVFLGRS